MRKIVVFEWITMDGIFDAGTMDQWFFPYDSAGRQAFITDCIMGSDAILLGRITYEMLAPYWSALKNNEMGIANKLNSVAKYVISSTMKKAAWNNTTIIPDNVTAAITRLKQQPGGQILVEGSAVLAKSLMEAGLVDEYRFLVHPVIMGSGKRFFLDGMQAKGLQLAKTEILDAGVIALTYQTVKK